MRGHIRKRGKNSYSLVISLGKDAATGKYKYHWESVQGTKKDAEKHLAEVLYQLDTGTYIKPGKTTLGEYLEKWLSDYVWPSLAPKTAEGYEHIIRRHLIPSLGNMPLAQLKPENLQRYYSEKLSNGRCDGKGALSPRTVRHHHVTLHDALESAVKWGLLSRNPADGVSPPRYQRPEWNTLSEDDIHTLLETAISTPYYALFHTAIYSGMRRSELLALRWSDIDLLLCQIYITRTLHHLRDGNIIFKAPKTTKGRRMIALSPTAVSVLREHKEKQELDRTMLGIPLRDDDLVFSDLEGKPLLPDTVTHAWIKLVRRTNLRGIRLHDARHSHASLMLKAGIHPKIVQERLGHSSIALTLDTYSHVAPGLQEAAAESFDKILNIRRENPTVENHYLQIISKKENASEIKGEPEAF
ncbi:MAG TPA: site-specific integrase [Dehalococcoidia bacterium]|nr:site-specific integrase [Dehalococcoidia bacterium]